MYPYRLRRILKRNFQSSIIERITIPGFEVIIHEEGGGVACGPVWGGTVTYGFVPQKTNLD